MARDLPVATGGPRTPELEEAVRLAQAPGPELERMVLARAVALKVDTLPYTELLP